MRIEIDGIAVEADESMTVLEAAARAGIEVPTLCWLKETGALTSCMICVVRDAETGRLFPSCATRVAPGMRLETASEPVREARRAVLRLLLSEHRGDCEGPCARICPAGLDVPRLLRLMASGKTRAAALLARRDLVFPVTLGYVCAAPCEGVCRRGRYGEPIAIRRLHGEAGALLSGGMPELPACAPDSGKRIAVVGGGLAGFAAAWSLRLRGHACWIFERNATGGAKIRGKFADELPKSVLDAEIAQVLRLGVTFTGECEVDADLGALRAAYDAVVIACNLEVAEEGHVFHAREDKMPVRAVFRGKAAAARADAFLRGATHTESRRFNSQLGKLDAADAEAYAVRRTERAEAERLADAREEAARCLHCDCLKPESCKLRRYTEAYGADEAPLHYMPKPPIRPMRVAGAVAFEPGKCVKCGICVALARAAGTPFALTMMGRGLDAFVGPPFGVPIAEALGEAAAACARACPTGAIAFTEGE